MHEGGAHLTWGAEYAGQVCGVRVYVPVVCGTSIYILILCALWPYFLMTQQSFSTCVCVEILCRQCQQ